MRDVFAYIKRTLLHVKVRQEYHQGIDLMTDQKIFTAVRKGNFQNIQRNANLAEKRRKEMLKI